MGFLDGGWHSPSDLFSLLFSKPTSSRQPWHVWAAHVLVPDPMARHTGSDTREITLMEMTSTWYKLNQECFWKITEWLGMMVLCGKLFRLTEQGWWIDFNLRTNFNWLLGIAYRAVLERVLRSGLGLEGRSAVTDNANGGWNSSTHATLTLTSRC